jgi:hypothetical protein
VKITLVPVTSRAAEVTLLAWARLPSHQQRPGIVSGQHFGHKDIEAFLLDAAKAVGA